MFRSDLDDSPEPVRRIHADCMIDRDRRSRGFRPHVPFRLSFNMSSFHRYALTSAYAILGSNRSHRYLDACVSHHPVGAVPEDRETSHQTSMQQDARLTDQPSEEYSVRFWLGQQYPVWHTEIYTLFELGLDKVSASPTPNLPIPCINLCRFSRPFRHRPVCLRQGDEQDGFGGGENEDMKLSVAHSGVLREPG
jgi:hypothetical protein